MLHRALLQPLIAIHRYLGIVLGAFFAMWFATGAVMLWVPFPSLSQQELHSGAAAIDAGAVRIGPGQAAAFVPGATIARLRLTQHDQTPAYRIDLRDAPSLAIDARSGAQLNIAQADAVRIAGSFFARMHDASAANIAQLEQITHDQWTVANRFDALRPLWRAQFTDDARTALYVSARTGEVVQHTTRSERALNWAGAVLHWVYFTPLRANRGAWDWTVYLLSLAGMVVVVSGVVLGIERWLRRRRAHAATALGRISPFRGWMLWHHVIGLASALFVLSWIFSGWLSMDHGRLFSRGTLSELFAEAYRGGSLQQIARDAATPSAATQALEIEWVGIGRVPVRVERSAGHVRAQHAGTSLPLHLPPLIATALQRAVQKPFTLAAPPLDDPYVQGRNRTRPAELLRATLADGTWIHIDGADGRVLDATPPDRRVYRWLFNGLHSLDFPFLTARPAVWWTVMLSLLALGFAFSVTAVVVSWRAARRSSRHALHIGRHQSVRSAA